MAAKLIALVLPLGLDTLAVSAGLGVLGVSGRRRTRISLLFAAFEAAMPLVGLAIGAPLGHAIGSAADYVAIGVLLVFGLYTLLGPEADDDRLRRVTELRGAGAVVLGLSVSLDELAIGVTLGLLRLPVGLVVLLIAVQAFVLSQIGLRLGSRLGAGLRERAEWMAGIVLTVLGLVLLAEKLAG